MAVPAVSVLAELDRYQIAYDWAGDDEVKVKCPFHDDSVASCNVSVSKRLFMCHAGGCGKKGDIITLLAKVIGHARAVVLEELGQRYDLDDVKIVEPDVVDRWHADIWSAGPLLSELYKRAVIDDDIKKYKLGVDHGRVTIPIDNERHDWVNVRKYLPGAPGNEKMKNQRGRGSARWFPIEQLRFPAIVLCGGELKSIVAARQLNPHGVGAMWATQGEKLLPPKLLAQLKGKSVAFCLDVDAAGRQATDENARALKSIASEILDVRLPLDLEKFPKGDINDFVASGGDMWELYQQAEPWQDSRADKLAETEPEVIHLSASANARYAGKRIAVTAITSAMDTAPYSVPKDVVVHCDRSQTFCAACPVFPTADGKFEVSPESPGVLECIQATRRGVHESLIGALGIPRVCRVCDFEVETYHNCEDVRLTPQIDITDRTADQRVQPAICVGEGLELNEPYKMVGRMWPHPQTQQATLLISKYEPTRDALSEYEPTTEQLATLDVFKPDEWTQDGIERRLNALYSDLELNVTRIYQRRDLHMAIDLAYHSPLLITFEGDIVKGWTEVLVVGDSAQGKSEAALRMMQHYGLGERIECKNASVAGLLGGLKQSGSRWMVEWGFIPKHDRRLVILEEIKGTSTEVIGKLTDMRSSGVAELSKIEKMRTHARTRAVWISNPRAEGRSLASYGYGIEAARELMGSLEDLRRFDLVLLLAASEVDAAEINRLHAARNGHHCVHAPDLCRALVLWAWTRAPEQCCFDKPVAKLCLSEATRLSDLFSDSIPVVDRGSARFKIARLAASLACRTFSASEDRKSIVVRECHVEYASKLLERIYSKPAAAYLEYTKAQRASEELIDPDSITRTISLLPFPYEFAEAVLKVDRVDMQDLIDWCGAERMEAARIMSLLVRKQAVTRDGGGYRKTPAFVKFLRDVIETKGFEGRPTHIPIEGEF